MKARHGVLAALPVALALLVSPAGCRPRGGGGAVRMPGAAIVVDSVFRLRNRLAATALASSQMDTVRLKLLRIGARVQSFARRIWFPLASGHP